ncbi:DUF4400 domain-containing protein [Vibrio metoecus]|nr:DUF4400 domain-containing protein [Vibrio cholerae]
MAENTRVEQKNTQPSSNKTTNIPVLSQIINVILKILSVSILAGFISIIIEFIIFFFVEDPVNDSLERYQSVSQFVVDNWLNEGSLLKYIEYHVMQFVDVEAINNWIRSVTQNGSLTIVKYTSSNQFTNWIGNWLIKILEALPDIFTLWVIVTFTWIAKMVAIVAIIPPCTLIIATGFIDGTVERKINTFKGKRDSQDKIEWWFLFFKSSSYSILFLYVALPNDLQAPTVLYPSAVISAIFLRNVASNYKKYC